MQEIEAKILEIDPVEVIGSLKSAGAVLDFESEFFAIYFDDPSQRLAALQQILRIRKEGGKAVLAFKAPHPDTRDGIRSREELEVPIGDFDMMRVVLGRLGYVECLRMRKIRTQYTAGGIHVVIDRHIDDLSYIPPYLEIEAPSHQELFQMAGFLGFGRERLIDWNSAQVMEYYREKG
ncbi:MAG: hypothetical protein RLZZ165_2177 [Bacteroidota bacterium]|jgi:predicted adenylyl cyclase CyaB